MTNIKCVEFANPHKEDLLAAIDGIRKRIEDGTAIGFIGISIRPDDDIELHAGFTQKNFSRLRAVGAVSLGMQGLMQFVGSFPIPPEEIAPP